MLSHQWRRSRHGPRPNGLRCVRAVVETVAVAGPRPEGLRVVCAVLNPVEGGVVLCPDGPHPKWLL